MVKFSVYLNRLVFVMLSSAVSEISKGLLITPFISCGIFHLGSWTIPFTIQRFLFFSIWLYSTQFNGTQCRHQSDARFCCVSSGSTMFAKIHFVVPKNKRLVLSYSLNSTKKVNKKKQQTIIAYQTISLYKTNLNK